MNGAIVRMMTVLATLLSPALASAQGASKFPAGNITIIVPYAPGGPPDLIARMLAPAMGDILKTSVIVENKPGASTVIGSSLVARAVPDGLTLMTVDPGLIVVPYMVAKPGFDVQKDFAWIAPLMRSYMTLIVNKDFPAKTVQDFVAMAKAKPGEVKYGTSGLGTPPYLGALAFTQATSIDLLHVPYRGVALALNDVIGGQISAVWVSQAAASAQVKGGLVRVLGVYGEHRLPSLPDVPTFKESGVDTGAADLGTWFGIAAPAATPPDIVAKLNDAVNKALRDPATRALLEKADFVGIDGGTPAQMKAIIDQNVDYWREAFTKAGVKPAE
jgi:tripartite-type tricarboxylate transporter receptor subunit TctC